MLTLSDDFNFSLGVCHPRDLVLMQVYVSVHYLMHRPRFPRILCSYLPHVCVRASDWAETPERLRNRQGHIPNTHFAPKEVLYGVVSLRCLPKVACF
jgi:hypothetical protein